MDVITLSIPGFFVLMGLEWLGGRVKKRRVYRGPDVLADLLLGSAQTLFGVVAAGVLLGGYLLLYERRFFDVSPSSGLAWVVLLVGLDFLYYWFHRASHRMNLAWAAHAPHHQSEDYNFAVALRQGPVQPLVSRVFYLPLALLGFPPAMFVTALGINTVYQFWIHTELVGKLGPLEWVLNTPSHHRVHHGCNGRYLDRNHGGILIIWDRLFGTFEPEADQPVYGTVKPVASWNPLVCAWAPFRDILDTAARAPRFLDKILVWIMPPEWRPRGMAPADLAVAPDRPKYDVRPTRGAGIYAAVMLVFTLVATVYFLLKGATAPIGTQLVFSAWFVAALGGLGGVLEGRAWAKPLEAARIVATPFVLGMLL
ncbi:sterol desaturase family protein [Polyangium jinanense]|uniref:Sterol desaturase family protein n=1 Tax=Polyangium jinanense TaxID=2829994 RepID=A0A9X3XBT8_9BACT|nr:sterol desaturase family protein [Polyangium jinanense]MDC3957503.1 sterol desaturase family protein [Polyangium jinanense]MDC3985006.1 sterol desaturase family protein [Polyangium jinanense]